MGASFAAGCQLSAKTIQGQVVYTEVEQVSKGVFNILPIAAADAAGTAYDFHGLLQFELSGVLGMLAIDSKGQSPNSTATTANPKVSRNVYGGKHLALVQIGRYRLLFFGGDTKQAPHTGSAEVES
jgi:hypothetical protein